MIDFNKFCNSETLYDIKDINHVESDLYVKNGIMYKKMNLSYGQFDNKLNTINFLIDNKNIINIKELVLPDGIAYLDRNNGIIVIKEKFIDNINFRYVLTSNLYSFSEKIEYFKQIGLILDRMKNVRDNTSIKDFYLCDLYTDNFILNTNTNTNTNRINVIDMDSCKINGNNNCSSYYLFDNNVIDSVKKYKKKELSWFTEYEINENTDILCYIIMLISFISGCDINKIGINEFYNYMDYLVNVGLSNKLVSILSKIYSNDDNINPYLLLDELNKYDSKKYVLKK